MNSGDYQRAKADNYEFLDGYYFDKCQKTLYLFQVTRNYCHPVNANGINKHLKKIGLVDEIREIQIRLIFVVPNGMGNYKRQTIFVKDVSRGTSSDISKISGIEPASVAVLATKNIRTVQELMDAMEIDVSLERYKRKLDKFMEDFTLASDWKFLQDIPQYALELGGDYK